MNLEEDLVHIARAGAERYLPRMLELLSQLCAVDCGTGDLAGNRRVIELLCPLFTELGARVEEHSDPNVGTHLVARIRPTHPPVGKALLVAHLDTVFGSGYAGGHPFHLDKNWAYGLGAGDCKSGVLIALFGALILKEAGFLPPWELVYCLTCDEETGSRSGSRVYAREAPGADLAFIFEGGREQNGNPAFVTARRGVIVGSIQVKGREAHAGKAYVEGRSAVLELAHQIIRLYSFNDAERGIYFNVAPISGGRPNGIVAGEARGDFCCAGIPTNSDFISIEKKLSHMANSVTVEGCQVKVEWRTLFPAMEHSAANHGAWEQAAHAARRLGLEPLELEDPSATDATYLSTLGVPTVDALSALAEGIHTTGERVSIPSLQERTALCTILLGSLNPDAHRLADSKS